MMDDEHWMQLALEQADRAAEHADVPVGAVVVSEAGRELGRGRNQRELTGDPTAHAEVLALRQAAQVQGHWRLTDATLFVTLEPCAMCAGAMVNARIRRLVYAAPDPKAGAVRSLFEIGADPRLNHRFEIQGGLLSQAAVDRLQAFFARLRAAGQK